MATNHKQSNQGDRPAGITCPHYEAIPGRKHCRHYLENGACARPDELMCSEWLKVNGHGRATNEGQGEDPIQKLLTSSPVDLFGHPNPDYAPAPKKPKRTTPTQQRPTAAMSSPTPAPTVVEERERLRGLTTEDIDGFKQLGVEVCLESEAFGEVWLVPNYTGRDRKELTPEHAATIARVMAAFPGSKVVSFEKSPNPDKEVQ
jgi:hypothetical protein